MKTLRKLTLLASCLPALIAVNRTDAATSIVADAYNVTGSGSGFTLGSGVNSGINPPTTRLTGSSISGLRYINTGAKATTAYTITSSKVRITSAANAGRFTLSANGTAPFDFSSALGIASATPATPVTYDIAISIDNDSAGIQRCSFALGTAEGDATTWDFGVQVYRAASGNNFYTIGKRIDTGSSGLASDLNAPILTMGAATYGTEITLLMRVTDAGSETSTYNSRIQLSLNGGSSWFYDTATDSDLAGTGFRLNGTGRYIIWDIAPDAGNITCDNFGLTWVSGPRAWTGGGANGNWSNSANWGGAVPGSGDRLIFSGSTRLVNTNDLSGLTVPSLNFNSGGFALYGNQLTVTNGITNSAGVNTLRQPLAWGSTGAKSWSLANGTEFVLDNVTTVEVAGDHTISGNATLRQKGTWNIGQATTANPAFILNEGKHILDGGSFASRGGYRIGSLSTGAGAQTIVSNGASFALTTAGANLRVGDSSNPATSQLVVHNSTLSMAGGVLAVPFAAGASGSISQVGGTISGAHITFSDAGAGTGSYTIKDGAVEPLSITKGTAGGTASIYFDNATLRPATGASANLITGLNTAQIQAGGLTLDATSDFSIGQALGGTGALTKVGSGKVTLTGANSYSGNTTISAGTLAVGAGGSIASSTITIPNGATFDVSGAGGYALTGAQIIARNATTGSATLVGPVTFNSGAKISLQANGTSGSIGTLTISGGMTLNNTIISIHVAGTPLEAGTYPLINYTGTKTGSFNQAPTITGAGIDMGMTGKIVETAGQISLKIQAGGHGIAAANLKVDQHDLANTVHSVTVSSTLAINGFEVRDGSNRGDFNVQIGNSATDDVNNGVLITSVSQNGRDHGEDSGTNYCTTSTADNASGYFVAVASSPSGTEYNINASAAYFPYSKYLGGIAQNSAGTTGGANNAFTGSAGLQLGTHFIDHGDGTSTVDLLSLGIHSQIDGVLLVTHAANADNFALSQANTNGTWSIYVSDNGTNGAVYEQSPVGFVFVPKSNVSVISGKFQGDGTILLHSGPSPRFSVTNTAAGTWQLTIPGYTPSTGVLIVSPEGGSGANVDNIISYQASGNNWIIHSRDIPGMGLQTPLSPVASFVFIPAPTARLVAPANNTANVASSPTLTVSITNAAPGNVTVRFHGHQAAKPYPGRDFLVAVLPDTQNYAREESGYGAATKEMWFAQTDWITANRVSENIVYVATLGDCVQNAGEHWQWRNATNAMYRLEEQATTKLVDGIPYGITVGNHDQSPIGDPDGATTYYNQYFGVSHFSDKAYYGGHFSDNNDNWYDLFSAGDLDFIVLSFEYGRYGNAILDWAENVLAQHPNRRVIVLTHHAGDDNADVNATTTPHSAQGAAIYDRLKTNPNFFLMLGGHVFNEGGEGRRSDTFNGKTVRTLVSDYQNRMNGGNGWMRLMYFSPSNNLVSVKTYSPYLGNYETDANSQFSFTYNMQPNGGGSPGTAYVALGTNVNVTPGTQPSIVWSGLQASKTYEWYVTVTDEAGDYSTSPEWKFTTTAGFARPAVTDADTDGLPDDWEASTGATEAAADDDRDGQSNYAEFLAKTNPQDANSVLKVLDATAQDDGTVRVTWSSIGGVRYRIQYAAGADGQFVDLTQDESDEIDFNPAGEPSTKTFIDTSTGTNGVRFYRIKVIP